MKIIRPLKMAKQFVEYTFGIRILRRPPRGLDSIYDLRRLNWPEEPKCIFDVGANVGQSAGNFSASFKSAEIHCFEPSRENYERLRSATRTNLQIIPHCIGVSSTNDTKLLAIDERPEMHKIMNRVAISGLAEVIQTTTLDSFCKKHVIDRINILKIDTEGHDMDVLQGSIELISSKRVDIIHCEAGMSATNKTHVPFAEIQGFLLQHGYFLFGFYEQTKEWIEDEPYLRRADVTFISPRLLKQRIHVSPPST